MLPLPPLYAITDPNHPEPLSDQVQRFGRAGFPLVQFRGKGMALATQWAELQKTLREAREAGGWPLVVVNDRADLAVLAAREGLTPWGLHLGQTDLPPSEARCLPGLEGLHLGTSTHVPGEWERVDPACDHAGVGPFRSTSSKPDHAAPIGLEGLRRACSALRAQDVAPVAIGGLREEDLPLGFEAGARALAMIGALSHSEDPGALLASAQALRWRFQPPLRQGVGVVLIGGSGSGKTQLARCLGPRLGLPVVEVDRVVAQRLGCSVAECFATHGERAFRDLERAVVLETLTQSPCVLDLGGGGWEDPSIRAAVGAKGWTVLWVAERPSVAWDRVAQDPDRPLARDRATFLRRWQQRMAAWSLAEPVLPLGRRPEELAETLTRAF